MTTDRGRFLGSLRLDLQTAPGRVDDVGKLGSAVDGADVIARAGAAQQQAIERAGELMEALASSAQAGGWKVHRAGDAEEALGVIMDILRGLDAKAVVRSGHSVLGAIGVDTAMAGEGLEVTVMDGGHGERSSGPGGRSGEFREAAMRADVGLTGADFGVAETGSVVLRAGAGVSRIVSLAPPVHVAVVERGTILPGLDELFALLRQGAGEEDWASYVNIISGPSRSADIEYTLITGVHGPGEVHLVLLDQQPETTTQP